MDKERNEERGAAMVEYGLLVALIVVIAIVSIQTLGTSVSEMFADAAEAIGGEEDDSGGDGTGG